MSFITATTSDWFLIGWIAKLLGVIMNWIFEGINAIGIPNIGIAIILFTIITKALMIPLSIKQQKYSKLQSIMQPELQLITEKYKDKKDNASLMAQQTELKDLYAKYGTSPTGGCLQLIIQMPILFALYQVIYHLPGYISRLFDYYGVIADKLMQIPNYAANEEFIKLAAQNTVVKAELLAQKESIIDVLYNFTQEEWQTFLNIFNNPALSDAYTSVAENINKVNSFCGIDLTMTPMQQLWPAIFIPILSGVLQWLSTKLMQTQSPSNGKEDATQSMTKSMNVIFPIMTVVFCFMFSSGLGVYWVASSGVQVILQLIVNNYMNKVDINDMVAKNIEKENVKRIKKGLPPKKVTNVTNVVHNLEETRQREEEIKKSIAAKAEASSQYYASTTTHKKGSLAEKAGMVAQYEERQKELKAKGGNKK